MTTEEWESRWTEGLEAVNAMGVRLERLKHNLAVIEENLDRLDRMNEKPAPRSWLTRLLTKENEHGIF